MIPRVSVIIPTHRRPELLAEAIASVRAQTFDDLEIVVADDGTEAVTRPVVERAAADDPRVRYVVQPNRGSPGATRNLGARAARGALLAFLDDDDLWLPHKLAAQVPVFDEEPDVELVFSHMKRFGARTEVWPDRPVPARPDLRRLLEGNVVPTSSAVVRSDVFAAVGGFDEELRFGEDYELWLRLARRAPLRALHDVHVLYREHAGGISRDEDRELECLARIYARARHEWGVPGSWLRPALRGLERRRAARARGWIALKHRVRAWLLCGGACVQLFEKADRLSARVQGVRPARGGAPEPVRAELERSVAVPR